MILNEVFLSKNLKISDEKHCRSKKSGFVKNRLLKQTDRFLHNLLYC